MTVKKEVAAKIVRLLEKRYPEAFLALNFNNPLQLLVATILAAQCTDKRVNDVTKGLFKKYKKAEDFERVKINALEKDISSISFYRNKARNIKECCKIIVKKYGANVPSNLNELISLPGIGRKTANIILGNAFGKQAIAVDTHVQRVSTRLGLATSKNPDNVEKELCEVVPRDKWTKSCHLFQAHGRMICTAKNPSCPDCILFDLCEWKDKRKK
ncbi:MAG: endonuclease III [Candidatus Scalindua rubra]|uniref:Endonuclease III n=1 Tax=Candidatus Scalindua rubra TaxID=1872076 RepID=A0A1E3X726_9BACT|nr:MAG: endonuclease III [Candidatus Scalindua rubra]